MGDVGAIEHAIKRWQRLINHILWNKEQIHTENSLSRFFRGQDVKSHLDRLVNLGILEKQVSGGVYTLSDDKSIHDIIKRVNEKDRVARNFINGVLSQIF